ncbi:excinuclease ABC subunit UvrA [Inmirania thermothiophila]|uniref:UvrABC system protein A n=1 Tax=Inmirania thermothiophila TaxID=1750597 RepID=A0A3N1YB31_9GAMM|nr:excinuclease ABC subunit UvrA [Inmirania thermothiophila]ROR34852.1 excinuclease ABC subunit A [Inmirania thermothiophila]
MDVIRIRGARTHNLKDIDLELPRGRLVVITGPSGSGKSSLAFDTLYAEGQRRYVESLSTYARQFLAVMDKPDVDAIEGLSPAIAIGQHSPARNPRSTVGTVTEIHDHLRLLYARAGTPHCPEHGLALEAWTVSQMVDRILALPEGSRWMLLAPLRGEDPAAALERLRREGFVRVRVDGALRELEEAEAAAGAEIEVVVDRFRIRAGLRSRLADSLETALALGEGIVRVAPHDGGEPILLAARHACPRCDFTVPPLEPRLFSFNNPAGACPACGGLGSETFFDPAKVVTDPARSLASGAIRGWDCRNAHYFELIQALAAHYGFDPETPFAALPARVRDVLLWGSGAEAVPVRRRGPDGRLREERRPFEGVIPNLERRYRETASPVVREELGRYRSERPCRACGGTRLNAAARAVEVAGRTLPEVAALPVAEALAWCRGLALSGRRAAVAAPILREIERRLGFLVDVGLGYLTLDRPTDTLSGGEAQRIRLAGQIGAGLVGVTYVLDEPSIGLHPRDHARLLGTLCRLRDLGNTVIVVEHDEATIRAADHVVDMGPGAGVHGGRVIAEGPPQALARNPDSLTGAYLSGRRAIPVPARRRTPDGRRLRIRGARGHNLRGIDVDIPLGLLVCVTGVSGSGKSTLVHDTLARHAARVLNGAAGPDPEPFDTIEGLEHLDRLIEIDQGPIGRTPRSNPATYAGLFAPIRELFAATPEARARGYGPGRFSFNVRGGRCEACQGDGLVRVEMHFLPDVYVPCEVCGGRRYDRETLEIRYKGLSIHDVLEMTVEEARAVFANIPALARRLDVLLEVGLGYLRLGQSATTLSGGEAQRLKLARELARRDTGRTLYILDEPTTGLHLDDIARLLEVLERLVAHGNTVLVIEHQLDVVKRADWIIDLGPEGGAGGGEVVACGPPEAVAEAARSHTGRFLRPLLAAGAAAAP